MADFLFGVATVALAIGWAALLFGVIVLLDRVTR